MSTPVRHPEQVSGAARTAAADGGRPAPDSPRILLVEDDPVSRAYLAAAAQLLERAAGLTGERWARPVGELARLLVTLVDGATTTWLVDRDTAATRAVLDASVELFVARHARSPA